MELSETSLQGQIIQKTSGVCGGHARVRNTRIPVWTLVSLRQQGATEQELLHNYPNLTLDDLTAVWGYYFHHKSEIDNIIASIDE
ncbi:MAG: DUF433 domain-containing protein [Xenococcus sp. MO_188.B8]|nr:DUF433 domain-containing protein [Xenococcus sp. MO_188.B8]